MNTEKKHTLKIENLSFGYNKNEQIFTNISFRVSTNETICLLGPNGCGKTTLLKCLIGINKPLTGNIFLDEHNILSMSSNLIAKNIGFVNQNISSTFDYKVIDYVVCGCAPHLALFKRPGNKEYSLAKDALKIMNIEHLSEKNFAKLSGGQQQQVSIARVLTQHPNFIIFDEPTSHLDFGNQFRVLKLIKQMSKKNYGIIMTTHNPDHALMMDGKTIVMESCGNYNFGYTSKIITEKRLKNLYQTDLYLEKSTKANRITCITPNF